MAEPLNISKPNTGPELQVVCPLLLNLDSQENNPQPNEEPEELKQTQLNDDITQQSRSTLVEEDNHQTDETKNSPLWSMYFDGSYTELTLVQVSGFPTLKITTQTALPVN